MCDEANKTRLVKQYLTKALLIGLLAAILVAVFLVYLIYYDIMPQYHLMTYANVGNLESDITSTLGEPKVVFEDTKELKVKDYKPVPEVRDVDKVVGYKAGKHFVYVFYEDDVVVSTFFSERKLW